ncbi:MAG: phosphatase PAP2 family protein [Rhodothermales bacterium]|nr:phosphatase PAP2 family protein [Rhodothermales bacterium]MBO6780707.1 phosphatase PAP2 family protein [Rhodothermales bacterium]
MRASCFLILSLTCLTADGQSRFVEWAVDDARALGVTAFRYAPAAGGTAATYLLATRNLDPAFNQTIQTWASGPVDGFLERTNPLGGPSMTRHAAAIFAGTLLLGDERSQDAAFTALESILYAGGLSYALKYAFGRGRPGEGYAADHFQPFSGHSSFPSGHTTTAFAFITPWVLYYDTPAARALLVLPIGTALARMDRDKHWVSDILAGGTLGILTARYLTRRHQGRSTGGSRPRVRVSPTSASLAWSF